MRRVTAGSLFTIALLSGGWRAASTPHLRAAETRNFVFRDGKGAVGGESFTRTADSLWGDLLAEHRVHYEARVLPNGTIPRLDVRLTDRNGSAASERRVTIIIGRNSSTMINRHAGKVDTVRVPGQPGQMPIINPSMALIELIIRRARAQKSQSVSIPVLSAEGMAATQVKVTFLGRDSVMLGSLSGARDQVRAALDADGHIRSVVNGADAKDPFSAKATAMSVLQLRK